MKVSRIIDKTNTRLKHQKLTQEYKFYNKNIKGFDQLDTFIPTKELFEQHQHNDIHNQNVVRQQQSMLYIEPIGNNYYYKNPNNTKQTYDLQEFWQNTPPKYQDNEEFNIDQQLNKLRNVVPKQQQPVKFHQLSKFNNQKTNQMRDIAQIQYEARRKASQEDDLNAIKYQAKLYKERSDNLIRMVKLAAKKIYNKKEIEIEKEQIRLKVEMRIKRQQRQSSIEQLKTIISVNKQRPQVRNIRLKKHGSQSDASNIQGNLFLEVEKSKKQICLGNSEHTPQNRKSRDSSINTKLQKLVVKLDDMDNLETLKGEEIRNMQNYENQHFETLRDALSQDQVTQTLRSLLTKNKIL